MPLPAENVSADLINLLKDRFEIADSVDEAGHFTDDPSEIKVFSFNFVNKNGEDKGSVVISLLDDSESSNSLKIYFGQDLGDSDTATRTEWYAFLQDIRQFAKMHLMGFDVRNINKSQISRRDVEKDLKLVTEDILPMFEGTFLPIDGTAKTSHQKLDGEPIKIVIKHTSKVDPEVRGSRSRRIARIYLVNAKNERFLLPFKNLVAARAMARHIENGGTPYDNVGRDICQLVEEMVSLNKFYNKQKKTEAASKPYVSSILAAVRERYLDIKKSLASLSSKGGYAKNSPSLAGNAGELEADDEVFEDAFDGESLDEESQLALPNVMRAYKTHGKVQEQDEFEKWVNAANGQGEGQDIIMDAGVQEECPKCLSKNFTQDNDGNRVCADCKSYRDSRSPEERDPEMNEDVENTPEQFIGDHCSQCEGEGCGHCDGSGYEPHGDPEQQEEAGKMAGQQDLAMLARQREEANESSPFEYGGMNGSIPTSDEISSMGGQMNLESEMSRLKKIVEAASKPACPHCGSKKYSLMPADFETAKCKDCGKNWDHGIVKGINDPFETTAPKTDSALNESIPDREDNDLRNQWTACEEYGHDFGDGHDLSSCLTCGEPRDTSDDVHDWRAGHEPEQVVESALTELFGFRGNKKELDPEQVKANAAAHYEDFLSLLKYFGFEMIAKKNDLTIWQNSYYKVLVAPQWGMDGDYELNWTINRNGANTHGEGAVEFGHTIMKDEEFRDHKDKFLKRLMAGENPIAVTEADVPSSSGWSGPLTWVNTKLGTKFRKPEEIEKHENTTGKLSPFSLLSTPERDVDDAGEEVPSSQPRGVRSIAMPNDASGIDSMSMW